MATVQFGKDRNWEGYIRIVYSYTQNAAAKQSTVTISDIQFQSIEGRTATWTAYGYVNIGGYTVTFDGTSVYTSGTGWASIGSFDPFSFTVGHSSDGSGSFQVSLTAYTPRGYNDFNVFHPNGGTYNCEYTSGTSLTVNLPSIDSSAPTITLRASINNQDTVTLYATSNVPCSNWRYQIDGGFTWTQMGSSGVTACFATIPNMSGSHSFVVRATRDSNGVTGYSSTTTTDTPSLSWSANTATTDGSILLSVSNLPANTPVRVKYGSTNLETNTWTTDKSSVGVLYSASTLNGWFTLAGVTTLQSITITASIDGYASATASFTLTAGENMKPYVWTPRVSIVQPARIAETFPDTWIANVSKAKLVVQADVGSNAAISSVVASYGSESMNLAYNSTTGFYEGTTSKPLTEDTTFTVVATDQRGLTGRETCNVSGVQAYSKPTITIARATTYRCNSSGSKQDGGPYVRVNATAAYDSGISGNTIEAFYFYVDEDGSSTTHNLTSGTQSEAFQLLSPRPDNAITVVVVLQDKISDAVTTRTTLPGAHRDVLVARYGSKTVVGIGQAPTRLVSGTGNYCDGVDTSEGGGYFVGGRDTINLRGVARRGTAVADLWGLDMLAIDTTNEKAAKNESRDFMLTAGALSNWQNLPAAIVSAGMPFRGIREIRIGGYYVVAVIIEIMPVAGRIWVNQASLGASPVSWTGWKGYTPDIT